MQIDDDSIYDHDYRKKQLLERKKRIERGEPPEKEIEVDYFQDLFSAPHILSRQEVDELTGQ